MTTADPAPPGLLEGAATGWYLIGANSRVEVGPFPSRRHAEAAAGWLDAHALGVNPSPWRPQFSRTGLKIGTRWRPTRPTTRHAAV